MRVLFFPPFGKAQNRFFSSLACLVFLLVCLPSRAAIPDKEALTPAVLKILKENPDVILDILKEHSETVLAIAQEGNTLRKRRILRAQWEQDIKEPKKISLEGRPFRGDKNAPVTIVAYSDFTCAYCRQSENTMRQLLEKFPGTVRLTFKALPKDDPISESAAQYATAAFLLDPIKGWKFFDMLFSDIYAFEKEGEVFLQEVSATAGYDFAILKAEADSQEVKERLDADSKEADRLGISGTPCFLINDLMVRGAVSRELFEDAIDMALKETGKTE